MNTNTSILVTGGTGFLGSYLLRLLAQKGYTDIRAFKRSNSPMALVQPIENQVQWMEVDMLDVVDLYEAMAGVEQAYHCAGFISYDRRDAAKLQEINVQGTANVVNAALHNGVKKIVHVSSIAALGRSKKKQKIDEAALWERSKFNSNYGISKHQAEMEVWRGTQEGLPAAIVNPSVILGSGFWDSGTGKFFKNAWNEFPFYSTGCTGFVDVRDVARLMVLLMESEIENQRFIVNADNWTYERLFKAISEAIGKKPPSIKVNKFIQEIAWRVSWVQARLTGKRPMITKETARHSGNCYEYDNAKSIQQLDFQYTPIEQTLAATATQFKAAAEEDFAPKVLPLD